VRLDLGRGTEYKSKREGRFSNSYEFRVK
jgi:hypothetical protein